MRFAVWFERSETRPFVFEADDEEACRAKAARFLAGVDVLRVQRVPDCFRFDPETEWDYRDEYPKPRGKSRGSVGRLRTAPPKNT